MNEEIKELLDILNKVKDYDDKEYYISCCENEYLLTNDEIKLLLNYITNLQKENEKLKHELKSKPDNEITLETKDGQIMTIIQSERIDMQEKLNKSLEEMYKKYSNYKSRNEKAVEFIKEWWYEKNTRDINRIVSLGDKRIDLYNILQGGVEND